jgi:uncharacterized protein YaiI (UPF0178 family)
MQIWVDADACPKVIKEILIRAANRKHMRIVFVANQPLTLTPSEFTEKILVAAGFDAADAKIVELLEPGDLVITGDIPLADQVMTKGGVALNPRGELYTQRNIKERLSRRNISEQLRSNGVVTGGPPGLAKKDVQQFSKHLDQILAKA